MKSSLINISKLSSSKKIVHPNRYHKGTLDNIEHIEVMIILIFIGYFLSS